MQLKIGELAEISGVTKRTIDYYTNLGLLKAERSPSNYRYYDHSAISQLRFIEECKREKLKLEEIKKRLKERDAETLDIQELKSKIKGLEQELTDILSLLEKNDLKNREFLKNNLSHESLSLIQSLLLLLI